jgi:large subunit ribosomal protein L9|tara:strand:- start:315 stop:767 length:453 start_codon:yes stop_codon:yes gene_type:complete
MQVILLEKISSLGDLGEVVNVKDGYGRNFLIPKGKAKRANAQNMAEFEIKRAELEKQQATLIKASEKKAKALEGLVVNLTQKSGADGKLFGSVTNTDVAEAIVSMGHEVVKSEIRMPDGPIKAIGEYELVIDFHHDQISNIKVVVAEEES